MSCAEIALQAGEQILALAFDVAVRQREQLLDRLALDQAADHRAGRDAVDVADHAAEFDAPVIEYLVQPVDFAGARQHEKQARRSARQPARRSQRTAFAGLLHEARAKNVVQKTAGNVLSLPALPTKAIT